MGAISSLEEPLMIFIDLFVTKIESSDKVTRKANIVKDKRPIAGPSVHDINQGSIGKHFT